MSDPRPPQPTHSPPMAVNELALAYQPRRVWGSLLSIGWNLALVAAFVFFGVAERLLDWLAPAGHSPGLVWVTPAFAAIFFAGYAAANYPIDLYYGYLQERQFALAKEGVRAWTRDWLVGITQQGFMFVAGACLLVMSQVLWPHAWLAAMSVIVLLLFVLTTRFALQLVPFGLFQFADADERTLERLRQALPAGIGADPRFALPRVVLFSATEMRDFAGGLVGLGRRQALLISRSTIELASETLLRFILLHELAHRRYRHVLLAVLSGWAWVCLGLAVCHWIIQAAAARPLANVGSPLYIAWLALLFTAWMAIGQPFLAYLGRRLEYQADRFYLANGGSFEEMRHALAELSRRNLARTDAMSRSRYIVHPLPTIANRIHKASRFVKNPNGARN